MGSVADGADGFQRHVPGALCGPFFGLLEQNGAVVVVKDAYDIGAALHLS